MRISPQNQNRKSGKSLDYIWTYGLVLNPFIHKHYTLLTEDNKEFSDKGANMHKILGEFV